MKNILYFLRELCVNNNRDWFLQNKPRYVLVKEEFESIVDNLIKDISSFDSSIKNITVKDCTYRINRDTRFSDDKTPYKNHMGAFINLGGKKSFTAGYYIHIEPDNSMIAGGIYLPPSDVLLKIRNQIVLQGKEFNSILQKKSFKELFNSIDGDTLKTVPRGFDKNFEYANLLAYKSYTIMHKVSDEEIEDSNFYSKICKVNREMYEFNSFLNNALK